MKSERRGDLAPAVLEAKGGKSLATSVVYVPTQTCTHCKADKPLDGFYRNARKRNGRSSWCKACSNNRYSNWHGENREKVNASWNRTYVKARGLVILIKERSDCAFCHEPEPSCLDFHHIDPSRKRIEISHSVSVKSIASEAKKCALLCRNCHAKVHAGVLSNEDLVPMTSEFIDGLVAEYALGLLLKED
jgi:hypothetical protein